MSLPFCSLHAGGDIEARWYVFSEVRPSSGAETQGEPVALRQSDPLDRADVAAAEDGRTPLNTYARCPYPQLQQVHCPEDYSRTITGSTTVGPVVAGELLIFSL